MGHGGYVLTKRKDISFFQEEAMEELTISSDKNIILMLLVMSIHDFIVIQSICNNSEENLNL